MCKARVDEDIPVFGINLGSIGQSSVRRFGARVEVKGKCRAEGPTLNMFRGPALIGHMDSSESPHTVPNQFMKGLGFLKHSETSSCQDCDSTPQRAKFDKQTARKICLIPASPVNSWHPPRMLVHGSDNRAFMNEKILHCFQEVWYSVGSEAVQDLAVPILQMD